MIRTRLDNTAMLEELHAKSIKRVFCNSQAREEALQQLRDRLQEVCKAQAPAKVRCTCPGCDRDFSRATTGHVHLRPQALLGFAAAREREGGYKVDRQLQRT